MTCPGLPHDLPGAVPATTRCVAGTARRLAGQTVSAIERTESVASAAKMISHATRPMAR